MSNPPQKCGPVEESTSTFAFNPRTIAGSSFQKAAVMALRRSGRDSLRWATPASSDSSKQS
jgi:hypothetical protein